MRYESLVSSPRIKGGTDIDQKGQKGGWKNSSINGEIAKDLQRF